VFNVLGLVH